ncbi:MAG: hypothetical protein MZW92_01060 [Comamonadaceae bacterium]|nr:hypothetical protein [Comamonadaceae bacterium]
MGAVAKQAPGVPASIANAPTRGGQGGQRDPANLRRDVAWNAGAALC